MIDTICIDFTTTNHAPSWAPISSARHACLHNASPRSGPTASPVSMQRCSGFDSAVRESSRHLQRDANSLSDLAILLDDFAQITPKSVLVHFLLRVAVPEPASVGSELVSK